MTQIRQLVRAYLILYLIETPLSTFTNIGDPDQAALVRDSLTLYLKETPLTLLLTEMTRIKQLVRAGLTLYLIEKRFTFL